MSYGLLKGKKGIIFGALDENSIAWKVAERCHEEGAEFVLTNAPIAMRMGEINNLAEKTGADIVPADATSMEDLEKLFDHAIAKFGKIDFILHSIGMSVNVRKGKHYTELNYDWLEKGWDVSAVSFHYFCGNSSVAESTIMEEILHRYLSCKVREKGDTVVCTFRSSSVS